MDQSALRVYPIKIMGDINDADYFLSVLHILSGGLIHNYYWSLRSPPVILIGSINYLGKILKEDFW